MQTSVIIGILFRLLSSKRITAGELADYFEVSERTVYRYLLVLEGAGVPIERTAGKTGGISIVDSFRLDRTYFTKEERLRIANSIKLASPNYEDKLSDAVLDKFMSLTADDNSDAYLLMTDTLVIDGSGWNDAGLYRHKISAVNEGIFRSKVIRIKYQDRIDEQTERMIEPHTLVLKEGIFYLYAYCRMRNDFRTFKLARINSVSVSDEIFTRRSVNNLPWNRPFREGDNIPAIIEAGEKILPDIEEWLGMHSKQQDGKYIFKIKIPDNIISVRKLLSYGSDIKVLSPDSLIDKLKSESSRIASLYNEI